MTDLPVQPVSNETQLRRLLNTSGQGLCEIDAQGRCTYINVAGAQILGREVEGLMGASLSDTLHPHRADGSTAPGCPICQALQSREPQRAVDALFWHPDGLGIPVSYSIVPLSDEDGSGAMIAFSDITHPQRVENELRQRTAELGEMERRRTEFIATLAHELRNPLAPIRTALQMMRKSSDNVTSMAQLRDMMERQLGQLVHLVNDLLDIARVSTGQMTLKKERVVLQEILRLAVEASEPLMMTMKNSLTLDIPAAPLYLEADATRLTQVFTNILNNAAQFSAAGSPISVQVKILEEQVRIDVVDVGVGIAREALNRIFDMFTRVGQESKNTHGGLGIGLNLSRRLVHMHDGELVADSEGLGKGSHFLITLPLIEPAPNESATVEGLPQDANKRRPIRALLIDDNLDAAASLSLLLQLGGHTTLIAQDGPEGLRIAADFKPDVVLLDLGLPGMDGYTVARAFRSRPELGHPILVAVTGWGGPEDRLRSKEAGFDEHLTKPVDISVIELFLTTLPARLSDGIPPVQNGDTIDASP
jgi:PAS domain S-box-containing protein